MKTISKEIYEKTNQQTGFYIKICVHFDFKGGFRYSVRIPNFSSCEKKLNKALRIALEHAISL